MKDVISPYITLILSMFDVKSKNFHGNMKFRNDFSTPLRNFDLFIASRRVNFAIRFKATKNYTRDDEDRPIRSLHMLSLQNKDFLFDAVL